MPKSQNGYPANDISQTKVWPIDGTTRKIRLHAGDCGYLLVHFAAWFDKHIETIDNDGELDDWGYAERKVRGGEDLSNHASGTAEDLNATRHPLAARHTFTAAQAAAIRAQLDVYEGCIRWGGDYARRADEMHFEIDKPYVDVQRVAARLRGKPAPAPVVPNVTIAISAIQRAADGKPVSDTYLADCRQFLAWCRRLGYITATTERLWFETREARHMVAAIRNVQRFSHRGLAVDGVFGPKTAAVMKAYGYTIVV